MITPWWSTQFWFSMMVSLLQDFPVNRPPNIIYHSIKIRNIHFIQNETAGSSFISASFRHPNIPPEITDIILEPWKSTTRSRCELVLRNSTALRYQGTRIPILQMELLYWHFYIMAACIVGYVQQ